MGSKGPGDVARRHVVTPNTLDADLILDRLDRIEQQLSAQGQLVLVGTLAAMACFAVICMAVTTLKANVRNGDQPGVFDAEAEARAAAMNSPRSGLRGLVESPEGRAPGSPVTGEAELAAGRRVFARTGGQWWRGEILEALADGRVKVRFPEWGEDHDEVVTRDRLRLPE
jgi:hypothetical protein